MEVLDKSDILFFINIYIFMKIFGLNFFEVIIVGIIGVMFLFVFILFVSGKTGLDNFFKWLFGKECDKK